MKKIVIAIIIAGVVGVGIGSGVFIYNKNTSNNIKQSVLTKKTNSPKSVVPVKSVNSVKKVEDVFSIFKNSKSISAIIAGNINVTMLPESIDGSSNGFKINEYYNQYSNQIMNLNVKSSSDNSFIMDESQNGQATGIYNLKFNDDKSQATGTFENVSNGKKSSVIMSFTKGKSSNIAGGSQTTSNLSNSNLTSNVKGNTVKYIINNFMGIKVGSFKAETVNSIGINNVDAMEGCEAELTTQVMYNANKIVKPVELIKGVYGYAISAQMYNPKSMAYVMLDTKGDQIPWSKIVEAYKDGTLIRYPDNELVGTNDYVNSTQDLINRFNNDANEPQIASYGLSSINFSNSN